MEFKIGDRVQIKEYKNLPIKYQVNGYHKMAGKPGVVLDALYSEAAGEWLYIIDFDDFSKSSKLWLGELLELEPQEVITYCHEFEYLDNVVVARFYEIKNEIKTEIARGHGHIIHEGALGIAQASSYALKRVYSKLNGEENNV